MAASWLCTGVWVLAGSSTVASSIPVCSPQQAQTCLGPCPAGVSKGQAFPQEPVAQQEQGCIRLEEEARPVQLPLALPELVDCSRWPRTNARALHTHSWRGTKHRMELRRQGLAKGNRTGRA